MFEKLKLWCLYQIQNFIISTRGLLDIIEARCIDYADYHYEDLSKVNQDAFEL